MFFLLQNKNLVLGAIFILLFSVSALSQNSQKLPDKIRGYKVYQTKISVKTEKEKSPEKKGAEAIVKIGEPELEDVSLIGITLEFSAGIEGIEQSGKIDFLTFEDFKVNNLDVEIEEYKHSFELKKNEKVSLPKPVKVFVRTDRALRGALKEWNDSKKEWNVTGTIFVFGKFKKFAMSFKRVVPIEINLKIENPLKKKLTQNDKSKETN